MNICRFKGKRIVVMPPPEQLKLTGEELEGYNKKALEIVSRVENQLDLGQSRALFMAIIGGLAARDGRVSTIRTSPGRPPAELPPDHVNWPEIANRFTEKLNQEQKLPPSVLRPSDTRLADYLGFVEGVLVYGRQPDNGVKPSDQSVAIAMTRAFRDTGLHLARGGGIVAETRISSEQYQNIYRRICTAPAANEKAVCPRP